MFVALLIATAAGLAPPYLAGRAIDAGNRPTGDVSTLDLIVAAFVVAAIVYALATYVADLPGRLGRHRGRCRTCASGSSPTCRRCRSASSPAAARGPDLAHDQRHRGAQPAGHRRRRDDLLQHPDPARRGRDPALPRRPAGAGHLPHLPAAGDRQRRLPDRLRRRLPGDAGADRRDHRLPAGDPQRRPRGAQLRPGAAPHRR